MSCTHVSLLSWCAISCCPCVKFSTTKIVLLSYCYVGLVIIVSYHHVEMMLSCQLMVLSYCLFIMLCCPFVMLSCVFVVSHFPNHYFLLFSWTLPIISEFSNPYPLTVPVTGTRYRYPLPVPVTGTRYRYPLPVAPVSSTWVWFGIACCYCSSSRITGLFWHPVYGRKFGTRLYTKYN